MSISTTLNNAVSGLNASARSVEIVSANVANAMTEGYGRREIQLYAKSLGGDGAGVGIAGVTRHIDQYTLDQRRLADAAFAHSEFVHDYHSGIKTSIGLPDDYASLTGRVAAFEAVLFEAASRPDSEARLRAVFDAASSLTDKLNQTSSSIQDWRERADQDIARQVDSLNQNLQNLVKINREIRDQVASGHDGAALMDQRQLIVDKIGAMVPIREVPRQNGEIAIYSPNGAILVDGRAATITFSGVGVITPDMTLASGALSGIAINGIPVATGGSGPLSGGSLGAAFKVRDELAPQTQSQVDAVARDLLERFADPNVDPSLNLGDAGLFADSLGSFLPGNEVGLSARLEVNALVDPGAGGALWRLRDGLNAAVPGSVGNASILQAMSGTLDFDRVPVSGTFMGAARSFDGLAAEFLSSVHNLKSHAETQHSFTMANLDTLRQSERSQGVDTDFEMQRLILIEQSYAANARVISSADEMLQTLLGL